MILVLSLKIQLKECKLENPNILYQWFATENSFKESKKHEKHAE